MSKPGLLDWDRVSRWTSAILDDDNEPISMEFMRAGTERPQCHWNVEPHKLAHVPLSFLLRHWLTLKDRGGLPRADQIDALDLAPSLGFIMLLDPVAEGHDFRYRLYGTAIAIASGADMSGKLVSSLPAAAHVIEFEIAAARAALMKQAPLYSTRKSMNEQRVTRWERIHLPLANERGAVVRLIVAAVPVGLDGGIVISNSNWR